MKLPARPDPTRFDPLFVAMVLISLLLAACNNGTGPAY